MKYVTIAFLCMLFSVGFVSASHDLSVGVVEMVSVESGNCVALVNVSNTGCGGGSEVLVKYGVLRGLPVEDVVLRSYATEGYSSYSKLVGVGEFDVCEVASSCGLPGVAWFTVTVESDGCSGMDSLEFVVVEESVGFVPLTSGQFAGGVTVGVGLAVLFLLCLAGCGVYFSVSGRGKKGSNFR